MLTTGVLALLMTQLSLVMNHERRVAQLQASQRKLRHLVDVDALTRLPNRRHFHELAERAVEAARDAATLIARRRPHAARQRAARPATGDEALRQVGTALRETLRRRDVAGRLGGDEFAVVLPRTRSSTPRSSSRGSSRASTTARSRRESHASCLNVGSVQMLANETIAEALRRAETALVAKRDEARRGDTTPAPRAAMVEEEDDAEEDPATPTPSALMSLIPVGDRLRV